MSAPTEPAIPPAAPDSQETNATRRSDKQNGRFSRLIAFIVLFVGSAVFAYPFVWMMATALRTNQGIAEAGISIWPVQWQWSNFADGLASFPFWTYLTNSVITTFVPVVFTVIASSLVGFAFARIPARGSGLVFAVILATMLLPGEVTLVPQFILFRELDMINTLYPIVLPALFGSPFFIFLFRQFYLRLPQSLTEAAIIDGASWFRIWSTIYLPLSQPIIVAAAVLQFMASWNNFIGPSIYLTSERWKTLPLALAGFSSTNHTNTSLLIATTLVVITPCIVVFFLAQKHIVGGISFTGNK